MVENETEKLKEKDVKPSTEQVYDTIIIGTGSAGMPAAIYAARFNMKTLIVGDEPGGLLTESSNVENYPGFSSVPGLDLMNKFKEHVDSLEVPFLYERVQQITRDKELFLVKTPSGDYKGKTIILTTGSKHRKLGIPGEKEFTNKGVSYCATCDAAFYKNLVVAISGGGDSAAQAANLVAEFASKVYVIVRKDYMRAEPINQTKLENNPKIEVIYNTNIKEIKGEQFVTELVLDTPHNGSTSLKTDGLFVEVGANPQSELAVQLGVAVDEKKEIIIDEESKTNVEGVYAAGDVANRKFKQALTGAAEGAIAAFSAYAYLQKRDHNKEASFSYHD